eukprot:745755-Hanusia_phi.AAC.5
MGETSSLSSDELEFLPLPVEIPEYEVEPNISSLPSWDSEATTETSSEISAVEMECSGELENELESLFQPEPTWIDPSISLP